MSDSDSEPAFPSRGYSEGMTLRDYFAGQALIGLKNDDFRRKTKDYAKKAYEYADAMIEERDSNGD